MKKIVDHLSPEALRARHKACTDTVEKSHYQVICLLSEGHAVVDVAKIMGFSTRWVELLRDRYNEAGPVALKDGRQNNGAPPSLLTPEVLDDLRARLDAPPPDGGQWSGPKVAAWLAERTGREKVAPQRGWEALKKLDFSLQRPRPKNPGAASEKERRQFKKNSTAE